MKTPKQEIEIAQQDLKQLNARLSNFLKFYWEVRAEATPTQIAAHNAANLAMYQAVVALEKLKEAMR